MNPILTFPTAGPGSPAPGLTFDNFVVGFSNRDACSAARSAAAALDGSLLLLCGPAGMGKTHLLNAIHAELLTQGPAAVIKHLNADDFTSCLIRAIHSGTADRFRAECQTADTFLLDDVHFLAGKERTQEELARILEVRCGNRRPTVLTLDSTSEEAAQIQAYLCRLPGAVTAAIAEPDLETRADIVRAKAAALELRLSGEDIELIAREVTGSLRNIQGVLNRINFYRSFPEAFPDAPTVAEIVNGIEL